MYGLCSISWPLIDDVFCHHGDHYPQVFFHMGIVLFYKCVAFLICLQFLCLVLSYLCYLIILCYLCFYDLQFSFLCCFLFVPVMGLDACVPFREIAVGKLHYFG